MHVLYYDKNFDYAGEEDIDVEVLPPNSTDVITIRQSYRRDSIRKETYGLRQRRRNTKRALSPIRRLRMKSRIFKSR